LWLLTTNFTEWGYCRNLLVITWDYEAEEKTNGKSIKFIPLWKWLLGEQGLPRRALGKKAKVV